VQERGCRRKVAFVLDTAVSTSHVVDLPTIRDDPVAAATRTSPTWERYAWVAGILYVLAVVAESAVGLGVGINQNDSAAKIATELADHRTRLVVVEGLCVVYAAVFPIYLWKLYDRLLRTDADGSRALGALLLVGGVLFVALHAVSDVGIYGVLDGKLASGRFASFINGK